MKKNHLFLFAAVTGIFVVIAVLLAQQHAAQDRQDKELLFPELADSINSARAISIQSGERSLSIFKQDGLWRIKEADNYPASLARIRQLALAASKLRILEQKTSKPALYAQLGVADPAVAGGGSLLTFTDGEKVLLALIVGKARQDKAAGARPGRYVRRPGSEQALLVEGELDLSLAPRDWLTRELFSIAAERIRSVQIQHGDAAMLALQRDTTEDALHLAALPEGRTVNAAALARVPALLEDLSIAGVRAAPEQFSGAADVVTTITTFDGLVAEIRSAEIDGRRYSQFAFAYAEPEAEAADARHSAEDAPAQKSSQKLSQESLPPPDVKAEVERLNSLVSGWLYEMPYDSFALFTTQTDDVLEAIVEDAAQQ